MDAQSEAACQRTDVPTTVQQSEGASQQTDVPTTRQQSEAAYQRTDVPTTMQQSEAAYQRTDVPTTMQQSEAASQQTDVPTTMQQSEAACQRTDVPTTMQQSEAAYQRTDVPTRMQQEAQVPAPSAAIDDGTLQEVAKRLGRDWVKQAVMELGFTMVQVQTIERNYQSNITRQGLEMLVAWKQAQSTSDEQQKTTLCTALKNIGRADVAEFLQGVPVPRPQQSQRPHLEPKLRAPSYQDVGNKTRDILKEFYTKPGSFMQLLPRVSKVQLETREGVAVTTGQKGETVNSTEYDKIFRLRTGTDELIKRFIVFGMGGVGKSTIFDRIAYDWAEEESEILKRFELVFLLKMCALSQESELVCSIFDQLLGEDSGIARDELDKFILANPNEILILLDGFDEMMTKTLTATSFGSILKALNRKKYRECVICVSTRPSHLDTLMSKSLVQNPCMHVEVLGFTDDGVKEYVRKFYDKDPDSGNALIQAIRKSNMPRDLAKHPVLLLIICLLWRKNKILPEAMSRLFTDAVDHMFRGKYISTVVAANTVIAIGQTALRGLMSANQTFSFQEDEFEPRALELALEAGILTQQRVIKNRQCYRNVQFMHKTMQEYCAAKYLQSLTNPTLRCFTRRMNKETFQRKLRQMCSNFEGAVANDFLFRFCCGDNERCMTDIVNLLDRKFNKDEPRYQSDVIQAISRNCFFESQSRKLPRCLARDSQIPSTIKVDNNNDFRSLIYLLEVICRSESRTAQLSRVETIKVSSVSSVSDLVFALGYMENLRELGLDECPLVNGDLKTILSCMKCNQLVNKFCIRGDNTLGGRAMESVPQPSHVETVSVSSAFKVGKLEITVLDKCVHLTKCPLVKGDLCEILSSLKCNQVLTDLCIKDHTFGGGAFEWTPHIKHLTSLNKLEIRYCKLQGIDFEHIACAVRDMPRLTVLILAGNTSMSGLWAKNLSRFTSIQTLNLSSCTLQSTDIKHIGDIPRLTNLIFAGNTAFGGSAALWAKNLSRFSNMQTLNLSSCTLQWTDIEHIASAIGVMPRLTDLLLFFNKALGGGAKLWAKELPRMTHLNRLNLGWCDLKPSDIEHIASAVHDMPRLTDLLLTGNEALAGSAGSAELWAKEFPRMTHLNRLDLGWCDLNPSDIEHIASAVHDMPRLTDLLLTGNEALGGSAELWAKEFPRMTHLNRLDLGWCDLKPSHIEHIASAVRKMPRLSDLVLEFNWGLFGSDELVHSSFPSVLSVHKKY